MNDVRATMPPPSVAFPPLAAARIAGLRWSATPMGERLGVIARVRRLLARDALRLAATLAYRRAEAETLVAEVLPLVEAARFLERRASRLLAPRRQRGGRPLWLVGVKSEIRREPLGAVLVLAPSNYPIFLPGVQILQALAAGNAVCVKPAPGCTAPLAALAELLATAGLPPGLLTLLGDSIEEGAEAVRAGFDRIFLTGSAQTGRAVLAAAAASLTPCTMELSGSDAVFVLPGADLGLVADCVAYGLRLNGGATCIAPRRIFVVAEHAPAFEAALLSRTGAIAPVRVPAAIRSRLLALVGEVRAGGGRINGDPTMTDLPPIVIADAQPQWALLREDIFAPVVSIVPVADMDAALTAAALCPYALGASVFGPERDAQVLAARVNAGSVVINDMIVPTADPRLPFGGRGASGFGVTRGGEGLLEMTALKAVSIRRGRFRPHLVPSDANAARQYTGIIGLLHGDIHRRWAALRELAGR